MELREKSKDIRFQEMLFLWLEHRKIRIRSQTYAKYAKLVESHLVNHIGHLKMSELDHAFFHKFIEEKVTNGRLDGNGGLSVSYVSTMILIIRSTIDFAVAQNYCLPLYNNFQELPKKRSNPIVFTPNEQRQLVKYIQSDMDQTKLGILLCLNTGLRIGELCGLKWSDIDFKQATIYVQRTVYRIQNLDCKTNEPKTKLIEGEPKSPSSLRLIPIPSFLMPLLIRFRAGRKIATEWVLAEKEYHIPDPRTYQYRFKRYLEACHLPNKNFHSLRHTFATRCIEVGVDIKSLSEILGHASVNITLNIYVHSSLEQKRKQIELLGSIQDDFR